MTTAIILVTLVLLALGIVINGLLRLRRWLADVPPTDVPPTGETPDPHDHTG
ncbi:MAG: hypothetical protein K2X97_08500 [Mycobacteriaceae bacterium]|nr:hypothetical protein [Mycobacteriaceae bacterium]